MRMFHYRLENRRRPFLAFGPEIVGAFHDRPAVIAALFDLVDHLPQILADLAAPDVAGLAVEAVAPQLPQAIGVDFGAGAFPFDERVIFGDAVISPGAYAARL